MSWNDLIQSKVFEQAVNIMGDTIEDMDVEIEQTDKKRIFRKKGIPDSKVTEFMNKLGLNKLSSKTKVGRIMEILNKWPNNQKYFKNKKH